MKSVCIMPVRSEGWCLGLTASAVLMWVDELIILEHASTDGTIGIISALQVEYGNRVQCLIECDPQWKEMEHRQRLLDIARDEGATHIVLVDADEILSGNLLEMFPHTNFLSGLSQGEILQLPWLCLRGSIDRYQSTGVWSEQFVSTAFLDDPRYHWAAQGAEKYDHHHRHPMGAQLVPYRPVKRPADGGLMHLQFSSERRLRAKQCLYSMNEVLRWPGREPVDAVRRKYSLAVYGTPAQSSDGRGLPEWAPTAAKAQKMVIGAQEDRCEPVPDSWWAPYAHLMQYLHVDAVPWQELEVKRLMAEHGPERFRGLDLFGVC